MSMPPKPALKPLEVLKKGLSALKKNTLEKKTTLRSRLAEKKSISSEDERWLDNDANLIDEQVVIDTLENASDYERGLGKLGQKEKDIVTRLRQWAGDLAKVVGNKRKRTEHKPTEAKVEKKKHQPPKPVFTKKENATLKQRIEVLDWHHKNGANQTKTAVHFDPIYPNLKIKQPLVSSWLKEEDKWRQAWEDSRGVGDRVAKRKRQTEHPEITEMMDLWVLGAMADGIQLTGEVLRQKWKRFADLVGVPEDERLNLSDGWLTRFKGRNGLKEMKRHGEAGSANPEVVARERQRVQELVKKYGYELRDVFNMDETGLFYGLPPDRGLSDRKRSGVKGSKVRLTYAFTSNADGSEKLPPFVIGKAYRPHAFNRKTGAQLGFYYRNNAKAWMTGDRITSQAILSLPPSQTSRSKISNPTSHPMSNRKTKASSAPSRHIIERNISNGPLNATMLELHPLKYTTLTNFRPCGWLIEPESSNKNSTPLQPSIPISSLVSNPEVQDPIAGVEEQVEVALDGLVERGVLQTVNRMDIEALLNPVDESHTLDECSDEEIFTSVMAAVKARQEQEITGGDDVDEDGPSEPCPSVAEVLKAVHVIHGYIDGVDDPVARNLDGILRSFNRQICLERSKNLRVTTLHDYFTS